MSCGWHLFKTLPLRKPSIVCLPCINKKQLFAFSPEIISYLVRELGVFVQAYSQWFSDLPVMGLWRF
jgi:hypothetical protein